jgi:elongation factor G
VQSQSITVDRQMRRYNVPRVAFVNKLDRQGANPIKVKDALRSKLRLNAVMVQVPIGLEHNHIGVIDLVSMRAFYNEGDMGETVREDEIPAEMMDEVEAAREELLDAASMFSDDLTEAILEEDIPVELLKKTIREATIARKLVPVFCGSAYKNKGVQKLLDGVTDFLPAPNEVENIALTLDEEPDEVQVEVVPDKAFISLAFKLEEGRYGQLTYIRVYQGTVKKGDFIYNSRNRAKVKVGRLVRMHSNNMEDIDHATAGDIVALFGVDCHSGDTFTDGTVDLSMTNIHVPNAVISLTINAPSKFAQNLSKALQRFSKEDPTFRVHADAETGETIVSGMGELHLEVYLERMRREYKVPVDSSPPRVAYREAITKRADFNYLHKKQTGGSGQYGRVAGFMEPLEEGEYEFVDKITGGVIPREYIPSCDKGFKQMLAKGPQIGQPVTGVRVTINDGNSHAVDSSDMAFQQAAMGAWRDAFGRARPVILEPVMRVECEGPAEFTGAMVSTLSSRRGMIVGSTEEEGFARVEAEVPLSEMFGYSTTLRSATQGKAEFSMEFARYSKAPDAIARELMEKHEAEKAASKKK